MNKEQVIKKICETYGVSYRSVYEACAFYLKGGKRFIQGYVVNDQYFFDILSEKIYLVEELTQLENLDEYDD